MGEPARADLDRPGHRDIVQTVYIRRVEKVGGNAQRRVRQGRERLGSVQSPAEEEVTRDLAQDARKKKKRTKYPKKKLINACGTGEQGTADSNRNQRIFCFMIGSFLGVLFDGFAYGMLLFLLSVGLSVTLGMMNFVNLAHCSFAMLGGYVTVTLMNRSAGRSSPRCRWRFSPPRRSASCWSARFTGGSTARATSTSAAHHRPRVRFGSAAAYLFGTVQQPVRAGVFARLGVFLAQLRRLPAFPVGSRLSSRCCLSPRWNTRASARRCAPR